MSKRRRRKSIFPKIIFPILFIVAAIISVLAVKAFKADTADANQSTQNSTLASSSSQQQSSTSDSAQTDTQTSTDSTAEKTDGIENIDASDPNLSNFVTGSVSKAIFTNDKYRLAVTTDQALSEGNCELTFWSDAKTLTASAEIVAHPNSSSCTFDLNASAVEAGFWNIQVVVTTTQDRSGIIEDKIEVIK